ncbi:MAG: hypothetical protein AAFQ51_09490 [Pseudomonadota bacterium]
MIGTAPKTMTEAMDRARSERSKVFLNGVKALRDGLRTAFGGKVYGRTT